MPSTALAPFHRGPWRYLRDRDVLHALAVALLANLCTGGLVWVGYLLHTWRVAAFSPRRPARRGVVLVFGRRLVAGRPERGYQRRLARSLRLARTGLARQVLLLGGVGDGGDISESAAGARWLARHGPWPDAVPLTLEHTSVDSLENLRHARELLGPGPLPPVILVSSRYHLARCLLLARRLGFRSLAAVGAEARLPCTPRYLRRLLLESGYVMWIDIGLRWARLIGNRRMASRIR